MITQTEKDSLSLTLLDVGERFASDCAANIAAFDKFLSDTGRMCDAGRNVTKDIVIAFGPAKRGYGLESTVRAPNATNNVGQITVQLKPVKRNNVVTVCLRKVS